MIPYTYLVGWSQHDLWYYGVRYARDCSPGDLWVTYFTSSKQVALKRSELGEPDVVEVRKTFGAATSAKVWEVRVIRRIGAVRNRRWLNQCNQNIEFCRYGPLSPETKKKIGEANRENLLIYAKMTKSDATKAKISAANKNHPGIIASARKLVHTADAKKRIGEAKRGRVVGDDTRMKLSASNSGKIQTPETIAKRVASNTGKKRSEETKSKMRATWAAKRLHKEEK